MVLFLMSWLYNGGDHLGERGTGGAEAGGEGLKSVLGQAAWRGRLTAAVTWR